MLGGRVTAAARQCWATPWASSCAFTWSAQAKGWEEVKRSRVLILQSTGNSGLSGEGLSDAENDLREILQKTKNTKISRVARKKPSIYRFHEHTRSLKRRNFKERVISSIGNILHTMQKSVNSSYLWEVGIFWRWWRERDSSLFSVDSSIQSSYKRHVPPSCWLGGWAVTYESEAAGASPSQGTCLGGGSVPSGGHAGSSQLMNFLSHQCFSLSIPITSSLSKNHWKKIYKKTCYFHDHNERNKNDY